MIADSDLDKKDFILQLTGSWAAFCAALPRNIKESLWKCYNSLGRDGRRFAMRVVSTPDDVTAALVRFFALRRSRAHRLARTPSLIRIFSARPGARLFCMRFALSRRSLANCVFSGW